MACLSIVILFIFIGCSDINECSANSTYTGGYCTDTKTSCTNTVGSWTCTCDTGREEWNTTIPSDSSK